MVAVGDRVIARGVPGVVLEYHRTGGRDFFMVHWDGTGQHIWIDAEYVTKAFMMSDPLFSLDEINDFQG
jgi:hypothetical protein